MSAKIRKNRMSLTDQVRAADRRKETYRRLMRESAHRAELAYRRCLAAEKVLRAVLKKCNVEQIELLGDEIREAPEYIGQFGVGKNDKGEDVAFYRYIRADLIKSVTIEEEDAGEEQAGAVPEADAAGPDPEE